MSLCECGCGRTTRIAPQTCRRDGYVKGEHIRFIFGHSGIGRPGFDRSNEKHPAWKGDKVGYRALHKWLERHKPRSGVCSQCGATGRTENANLSGEYRRDVEDYLELCVTCHRRRDAA